MPRTNNNLEGWHSALQRSITQTHPNIWQMIGGLKKEEVLSVVKLAEFERSGCPERLTSVTKALQNLVAGYDSEDKQKFLRACALNLKLF